MYTLFSEIHQLIELLVGLKIMLALFLHFIVINVYVFFEKLVKRLSFMQVYTYKHMLYTNTCPK